MYYDIIERELSDHFVSRHEWSGLMSEHYRALGMEEIADRLLNCGTYLEYGVSFTNSCDPILVNANFCKHRLCPMCSWRRSLKIFSQVFSCVNEIEKDDNYQFVFVTLTVRNVSSCFLKDAIEHLNDTFSKRFLKRKIVNGKCLNDIFLGYFKSLEITYNSEAATYHPHLHLLCVVRKSYFTSRDYISHDKLMYHWKKCLGISYDPFVDIEKVKPSVSDDGTVSLYKAVAEVAKYSVKSSDIMNNCDEDIRNQILTYESLSHFRFCSFGGIFREVHQRLKLDDMNEGDLVNTANTTKIDLFDYIVRYKWTAGCGYVVDSMISREKYENRY